MITIITGDDLKKIETLKAGNVEDITIFRDIHPAYLIKQCSDLVKKHGYRSYIHKVITFNPNVIQALCFFSHQYYNEFPDIILCTDTGWKHLDKNNAEEAFNNLIEPLDYLFMGKPNKLLKKLGFKQIKYNIFKEN